MQICVKFHKGLLMHICSGYFIIKYISKSNKKKKLASLHFGGEIFYCIRVIVWMPVYTVRVKMKMTLHGHPVAKVRWLHGWLHVK